MDEQHLALVRKGRDQWNTWRWERATTIVPDLSEANLTSADLAGYDLSEVNLRHTLLQGANLQSTQLARLDGWMDGWG